MAGNVYRTGLDKSRIPYPWNESINHTRRFRNGYFDAIERGEIDDLSRWHLGQYVTEGRTAYLKGFELGMKDRVNLEGAAAPGHQRRHRKGSLASMIPERFTSGLARKAWRIGYRRALECEPADLAKTFALGRLVHQDERSWNSQAAFEDGWRAGLEARALPPPQGQPVH